MAGNNKGATLLSLIDEERLQLWKKSYHLIDNSPVVGTGPGNWQVFFPDATLTGIWRAEDLNFTFQRPHNDLLWILSETGYIGLNLWLLFLLGLILFALFRTQQAADQQQKNQVLILTSALVGFTVMSFFDFPKERIEHLTWFGILAALTCGSYYSKTEKSAGLVFPRASVIVLSVSAIFALAIGVLRYTGEYYTRKLYDYKSGGVYMQVIKSGNQGKSLAYSLDPTSVPLSWYTGNAFASLGQYDKAFADLLIAYKEHPYNRNVLNDLGSALVFKGDTSAAIEYYSEAARISPRYDEPRLNLAAIQIARKKYQEANRWLSSVMHDSERRTKYQRYLDMMLSQQAAAQ